MDLSTSAMSHPQLEHVGYIMPVNHYYHKHDVCPEPLTNVLGYCVPEGGGMQHSVTWMTPTEMVTSLRVLRKLCSIFFNVLFLTLLPQEILSLITYSWEELLDIRATSTYQHYGLVKIKHNKKYI